MTIKAVDTQAVRSDEKRRTWDSSDALLERHAQYAELFEKGSQHVLDLQCGNGEFLELLSRRGATGVGLEADESRLATLAAKGVLAQLGNPHEYLASHVGEFDGIFASHVIEHLDSQQFINLVQLAVNALKPRGRLVIVSTDPRNLASQLNAAANDLDHVRFYGPDIVRWVARDAGLRVIDVGHNRLPSADGGHLAGRAANRPRVRTRLKQRLAEWLVPASLLARIQRTEDQVFYPWAEFFVTGIR